MTHLSLPISALTLEVDRVKRRIKAMEDLLRQERATLAQLQRWAGRRNSTIDYRGTLENFATKSTDQVMMVLGAHAGDFFKGRDIAKAVAEHRGVTLTDSFRSAIVSNLRRMAQSGRIEKRSEGGVFLYGLPLRSENH